MIFLPKHTDSLPVVILAAGDYPSAGLACGVLASAGRVVCCDGAAERYMEQGGVPYAIVGDCDSLDERSRGRYTGIVHCIPDQETNDLTKAVNFCLGEGATDIVILGATGKREDHTVANISLMADYAAMDGVRSVRMITDYAVLDAVCPASCRDGRQAAGVAGGGVAELGDALPMGAAGRCAAEERSAVPDSCADAVCRYEEFVFESVPGQQVSIFTPRAGVRVTTRGLRYPLERALLQGWWTGTLNESVGETFSLAVSGPAIVYRVL